MNTEVKEKNTEISTDSPIPYRAMNVLVKLRSTKRRQRKVHKYNLSVFKARL